MKALLLLELNTQEHNDAAAFSGTLWVVLLVFVHGHVVQVDAHAEGLHTHMVGYSK